MNQPPCLLIVDDEVSARDTLEALLHCEAYELIFAESGPEALACLDRVEPDVILLDVMMPGMDGFEVCQRLKADKSWRHVPIILITALNDKEDVARGLDVGADEFLSKPVNGLELRARVRSMLRIKQQFDELTAMLQLREDLSSMVVHDMRMPLTVILGFSELLLRTGSLTPQDMSDMEKIHNQTQRLQGFTNDLLMLAKSEQDQLRLNRSLVDVKALIAQVEDDHRVIAEAKRVDLVVKLPPGEARPVWLDVHLFQRLLDNLISNALKFSPDDSRVELWAEYLPQNQQTSLSETGLRIKVIDEGPGIAPEHRDQIFDKFKVVDLKRKQVAQFGLGLTFCKLIVAAHGGRIWVEPNYPMGSIFVVEMEGHGSDGSS